MHNAGHTKWGVTRALDAVAMVHIVYGEALDTSWLLSLMTGQMHIVILGIGPMQRDSIGFGIRFVNQYLFPTW